MSTHILALFLQLYGFLAQIDWTAQRWAAALFSHVVQVADMPFGHPPEQDFAVSEAWWCRLFWLIVGVALFEATHIGHRAIMRHFHHQRRGLSGLWRAKGVSLSIPVGGHAMALEIDTEKYTLHPIKERDGTILAEVTCDDHGHLVATALLVPRGDNGIDLIVASESKPAGPFRLRRIDNKRTESI